ncbi:mechanosensitive ion channel domain-containing protein [Oceaniovalibus sp. ACAM 378]|uniref:mechanosensitive ion channel domain-containing protein n=1 Tax=Oceaniovalibus sp. ACAM 378 TaxID=2599923 RepID=UPI00210833D2|nr:mechanosensitive ion channel domain-containing protein [Oceaniovalibus sp. ACAM 378]
MSRFALCLAPLLIALLLAVPMPAGAQDTRVAEETLSRAALEDAIAADARISERMRAILTELDGYEGVYVSVRSGIVTLTGEVLDGAAMVRLEELATKIEGVIAVQNEISETTDLSKRLDPAIERMKARLRQGIAALPLVAVALSAAALMIVIGIRIARMHQPWERLAPNAFIANIYRQLVFLVFVVSGMVIGLDILNATALLGTILGAAGIIGLAIGFAVRDTVENFIASIMLSIRQPFQPNDAVEIGGDEGKVIRLTSRATILLSFDGNHIRIPNSTVFKSRIVNFTRNAERRFQFDIAVEADSDLAAVRGLIEQTVSAMPFTLETPGTSVWIKDLTDAGVVFTVTGWIDQTQTSLLRARGETLRLVKQAIESGGYAIPDTTYRIRIDPPLASITATPASTAPAVVAPAKQVVPPAPVETAAIGVDIQDDQALEQMIAEERNDESNPDLLRADAPSE